MKKGLFLAGDARAAFGCHAGEARRWRGRRWLVLLVFMIAAPVFASTRTLYGCVEPGKPTSYQNEPCPPTSKTKSAVDYVPERYVPAPPPSAAPPSRHRRIGSGGKLHAISRAAHPSDCEAARQRRERVLGRNNQGGNVDVRRQLNDAVARACN
ncbi:MAG: hypothetical protein M3Q42_12805 [Pseudomonadota bacterium]|nr:hypothetical protein [Pseudomonadota bacterium]